MTTLPGQKFQCFVDFMTNKDEVFLSTGSILVKFANNVLKDPSNTKYRKIRLGNEIFMTKLLPVHGAVECLFGMGFQEESDELFLPTSSDLEDLKALRGALIDEISKRSAASSQIEVKNPQQPPKSSQNNLRFTTQQKIVTQTKILQYIPRLDTQGKRQFYDKLTPLVNQVYLYENEELQKLALSIIPNEKLLREAKEDYQEDLNHNGNNPTLSEKDYHLLRLLAWFKNDFFTWTNSPKCHHCSSETKFYKNDVPNIEERVWHTGNVECYRCGNCNYTTRFPRYNHPQKLLETRTGRCGEWANCFTLCCRAVGFEVRYILDFTDHVWTEVYSDHQKRWLHCDSCENVCDKPLLYENGWGKKLSYVFAFSKDEIIDVTWRYSMQHVDILSRRKSVPENWLVDFYSNATKELQSVATDADRKSVLMNRHIVEIVEFISPKKPSDDENKGRISGSLAWRTARGETNDESVLPKELYVFKPNERDILKKGMNIRYFPADDIYILNDQTKIKGWENGVSSVENVFRKVESDWKMIYLARTEGSESGKIKWSIDIHNSTLKISHVNVIVHTKLYENGKIDFKLISENDHLNLTTNHISTDAFAGSKTLHLEACLKGSSGNVAWQHAQLFRCAESDTKFVGLEFDITFQD